MRICIVAEGCYPYVVGGVSSWIHSMIKIFPEYQFVVLAIVANRSLRGKIYVYDLPENVWKCTNCIWRMQTGGQKNLKEQPD